MEWPFMNTFIKQDKDSTFDKGTGRHLLRLIEFFSLKCLK